MESPSRILCGKIGFISVWLQYLLLMKLEKITVFSMNLNSR